MLLCLLLGFVLLPARLAASCQQPNACTNCRTLAGVVAGDFTDQRSPRLHRQRTLGARALADILGCLLLLGGLLLLLF